MSVPYQFRAKRAGPPVLPFVAFNIARRIDCALELLAEFIIPRPVLYFRDQQTLACIATAERQPVIEVHDIINIAELPLVAFDHILIHELLHLVVPPREIEGKMKSHPPEFWKLERRFSPRSDDVWQWLNLRLFGELVRDEAREEVRVKRGWRKRRAEAD